MTAVPFPLSSAPGRKPQAGSGRLLNCFPERLGETAGAKVAYWRSPGLAVFGTTANTNFRGGILVGTTAYVVVGNRVFSFTSAGGVGTQLTGTVPGTVPVFLARNNAAVPDVVMVIPGDGARVIAAGAVAAYPDSDVGQPNSVRFHKGFFVFTYGNGTTRVSGVNNTSINTLDVAIAESKPDTLYCAAPLGNGQMLLCGSTTLEAWGGANDPPGYPFSYIATINRGIISPHAICGFEEGFGKGIFFASDDCRVHKLSGYDPVPISSPDVDRALEAVVDKSKITVSPFMTGGHGFIAVQSDTFCWVYDVDLDAWHERESYSETYWRARFPFRAFDKWLCGDTETGSVLEISRKYQNEINTPLNMRIETGPFGAFPHKLRINAIDLYVTKGAGLAPGNDPNQTDPSVGISMSRNGGQDWTRERPVKIGRQSVTEGRVRSNIWGQADQQGVRWRFDFSSDVDFGFMGADMQAEELR